MIKPTFITGAAAIIVLTSSAASACSQRGQFCSYPSWAANAFESPRDRKPGYNTQPTERPEHRYVVRKVKKKVYRPS